MPILPRPAWIVELEAAADRSWRTDNIVVFLHGSDEACLQWAVRRAFQDYVILETSLGMAIEEHSWKSAAEALYDTICRQLNENVCLANGLEKFAVVLQRAHEFYSSDVANDAIVEVLQQLSQFNIDIIITSNSSDYGATSSLADVHISVPSTFTRIEQTALIHLLIENHAQKLAQRTKSNYPKNTTNPSMDDIERFAMQYSFESFTVAERDVLKFLAQVIQGNQSPKNLLSSVKPALARQFEFTTWSDIKGLDNEIEILQNAIHLALFDTPSLNPASCAAKHDISSAGTVMSAYSDSRIYDDNVNPAPTSQYAPTGILLHGPPGTGKTMIARAISSHVSYLGGRMLLANLHDIIHGIVGDTERSMRLLFDDAVKSSPAIIFFDELDAFVSVRRSGVSDGGSNYAGTVASVIGEEFDRLFSSYAASFYQASSIDRPRVVVLGATNLVHSIPTELKRHGRFDCVLEIPSCNC